MEKIKFDRGMKDDSVALVIYNIKESFILSIRRGMSVLIMCIFLNLYKYLTHNTSIYTTVTTVFANESTVCFFQGVIVQSLSCVWLFSTPWTMAQLAPLSSTISQSLFRSMFIELVTVSNHNHNILFHPLLLPPVFRSIRDFFSNESALHIR